MKKHLMAAFLLLLPVLAHAAEERSGRPHWSLELKGGAFFPATSGWSRYYGKSYAGEYGGSLAYKPLRQVEVGIEGSYSRATGKGQQPLHNQNGGDQETAGRVTYQQVPLNLFVLTRALFSEDQWLVPYAGGGYTRMFYRQEVKGQGKSEGSVNGYHARGGVQLLLDRFESSAAGEAYREYGLDHTYLFVEGRYTSARVETVPSGSVNLGGISWLGGFLFEF